MSENKSQILPLLAAGKIKYPEEYSKIQVNCVPKDDDGSQKIDNGAVTVKKLSVLYPTGLAKDENVVPLVGGAVVKLQMEAPQINTSIKSLTGKYAESVGKLEKFVKKNIPAIKSDDIKAFVSLSKLVDVRMQINRALEDSPTIPGMWSEEVKEDKTNKGKVPSLTLSKTNTSAILPGDLQNKIKEKLQNNARLKELGKPIGFFKFIPLQVLRDILVALMGDEESGYGMAGKYVGMSGYTFKQMHDAMAAENDGKFPELTEDKLVGILLDLFPIIRLSDSDILSGQNTLSNIGYYTAFNDSLYIKMPDLSARDSNGDSPNIYGLGEEDLSYINFCFELVRDVDEYSAKAFDFQPPPDPIVEDASAEYPKDGEKNTTITILKEGLDERTINSASFFLSPIFPAGSSFSSRGFVSNGDATEMFLAPVLTQEVSLNLGKKGLLSFPDDVRQKFLTEFSKKFQTKKFEGYNAIFRQTKTTTIEQDSKSSLIDLTPVPKDGEVISSDYRFSFYEIGLPMSENLSNFKIDSAIDLIGESNRPEVVLGRRDGQPSIRSNNAKLYDSKVYSARKILVSNRPNIVNSVDFDIPALWIPLSKSDSNLSDVWELEIPAKGKPIPAGPRGSLELYNDLGISSFALYVVDKYGQITRASGENITITPSAPLIKFTSPNGYKGSNSVISLDKRLYPEGFGDPNALTGLKIVGEGFAGPGISPTINFYSDEGGNNLLGSLKEGQSYGGKEVKFSILDENQLSIETGATFGDFLPNLVGPYHVGIELPNGLKSPKLAQLYMANTGTSLDDLPSPSPEKIKFFDSFGIKVKGFGSGLHSVPIVQDGTSGAELTLKTQKKTFDENGILYAYLAILKNDNNKSILTSDVGWIKDSTHTEGAIVEASIKTSISESASFYIPTSIQWRFGESDFERVNSRKIKLKIPGGNIKPNMNRFDQFTAAGSKEHAAYILLSSTDLSKGGGDPNFINGGPKDGDKTYDYAVIPVGKAGATPNSEEKPFVRPPEILGFIAELPSFGGERRIVSNIPKASLASIKNLEDSLDDLSIESIKGGAEQTLSIISSDALERLSIIFKGQDSRRMRKAYSASVGRKKIDSNCTSIRYLGENKVVANYRSITGITDEGWIDVVVTKKDKDFKCSYDSTLYNRVTLDIKPEEGETEFVDKDGALLKKEDILIPQVKEQKFVDFSGTPSLSTVIFPGDNGAFTPLPLIKGLSYSTDKIAEDLFAYYYFSNPIKIKPSLDLVFGTLKTEKGKAKTYGMALTDSPVDDNGNPGDEIIKINKAGKVSVALELSDMARAIESAKKEAEQLLENIKEAAEEVKDTDPEKYKELTEKAEKYKATEAEASAAVGKAQDAAMTKEEADAAAMEAAQQAAQQAGGGGGALDGAAGAAEDAAQGISDAADALQGGVDDALGAVNDALSVLQTITDTLSSITDVANQISEGVEGAAAALGSRPDDFIKVNIKNVYIDKDTLVPSSSYISKDDKTEYKLITSYEFSQVSSIKFNVPEIIEVRKNDPAAEPYLPFGERPFSTLRIMNGDTLYIKTIGANQDTKFELGGKRVEAERGKPFAEGIYTNFVIKIIDLNTYPIFGTSDCISITATNSNLNRMRLGRQLGNDLTINLEDAWDGRIFGGGRNKQGPSGDIAKHLEKFSFLKFTFVKLSKIAGGVKESLQSFCDFSLHLTAELSLQLRNFQVLMVPIKVIFCIIDVICALLNPWRLAFAIIRLFLCLYDLILLLPPIAVPAMYLALLLHLLDLLLCVILKILSTINAINEVVTALQRAIEQKNYPAVVALEEALNEHIFSLEADLSVLEPIITILALFLELLQLAFAFPCRVGSGNGPDNDPDPACIDPSQLAGIILGKVAPTGKIAPNVLLPLAQAYTRLPAADVYSTGNSPPSSRDNNSDMSLPSDWATLLEGDIVVRPEDEKGSIVVEAGTPGFDIPNHKNNATGELVQIEEGGFFRADEDGDGNLDNIYYPTLRTNYVEGAEDFTAVSKGGYYFGAHDGYFDATFALSFTKSTKSWSITSGPDPAVVRYNFDSAGVSSDIAWWTRWLIFPIFFSKKTVSEIQTIDSPPMFLGVNDSGNLIVDAKSRDFVSPIDGFSDFLTPVGNGLQPKPLTVTFELNQPTVNPETKDAEFVPVEVTKTFGNIPMIAVVDEDFNVYFVEQDGFNGGIKMNGNSIESINLKMINYPSAPKKKVTKEKQTVFSNQPYGNYRSSLAETTARLGASIDDVSSNYWSSDSLDLDPITGDPIYKTGENKYEVYKTGEAIVQSTANAAYLRSEIVESGNLLYDGLPVSLEYILDSRNSARKNNEVALKMTWDGTTAGDKTLKGKTLTFTKSENEDDYADIALETHLGPISINVVETLTNSGFEIEWTEDLDAGIPYPALGRAYDFGGGDSNEQNDIGDSLDAVKVYDFPQFYIVDMRQLADDIAAACGASGPAELLMDLPGFEKPFEDNIEDMKGCMEAFMRHFDSEEPDEEGVPRGIIPKLRYQLETGILPEAVSVDEIVRQYEVLRKCVEDQIDVSCEFVVNPLNTGFKLLGDEDESPLPGYIDPEQSDPGSLGAAGIVDELEFDEDLDGFPSITGAMEYASGIGDTVVTEIGKKAIVEFLPRDCYDEPLPVALDMTDKLKIEFVSDETGTAKLVSPEDGGSSLVLRDEEVYTMAVTADGPGKVVIKGMVCDVVVQAVTDRGIMKGLSDLEGDATSLEGCIEDASASTTEDEDNFAPGALMKVDRTLTILFVPPGSAGLSTVDSPGALYGANDRDNSARSAKPSPQKFGTKLEN